MPRTLHRIAAITAGAVAAFCGLVALAPAEAAGSPVIYPAKGQSAQQLEQDKFSCFEWSKGQSGFDPMQAQAQMPPAMTAPPALPTGAAQGQTANASMAGMFKGAAGGAAVAELADKDAGKGAAVGALGGALRDRAKQQNATQAQQQQQQLAQQQMQMQAQMQSQQMAQAQAARTQQRATFERAFGACLEGRGYVVK